MGGVIIFIEGNRLASAAGSLGRLENDKEISLFHTK